MNLLVAGRFTGAVVDQNSAPNVDTMKKRCKEWREELKNASKFKQFYNYVFDYLREEKKILGTNYSLSTVKTRS